MKRIFTSFVVLSLLLAAHAAAQTPLRGRVIAGNAPVPNQVVTLHRVSDSGEGGTLAEDTTAADGSFEVMTGAIDTSAVYFVATVYENELYIGDTFQSDYTGQYNLPVGPGATPIHIDPPSSQAGPENLQTPEDRIAGIIVILAGILSVGAIVWIFVRPRPSPIRPLFLEIARLDEEYEQQPSEANRARRAELVRKIREAA